jgi:uncharacterized membrane protein (DUF373 family)
MKLFRKVVDIIVKLLIPFAILALMMGFARALLDLKDVFKSPTITEGFEKMVTDILSMFVVIELLRSIIEYFDVHRLRLTFIIDATIVFILREVMIQIYRDSISAMEMGAFSVLLLVLGALRTAAVFYSPDRAGRTGHE